MALLVPLVVLSLLSVLVNAQTLPTWPSPMSDELEDLMFLNTGYRARKFTDAITPCSKQSAGGSGPGRVAAAEWLRTTFHDVATANVVQKTGGLDASIIYELARLENPGTAFTSTITTYEPFFGPRVPMSELIALGTYASVRGCGGPSIPVRIGRVDARFSGSSGVPQPQNELPTFRNQFARLGMNDAEMIAVTACGHSLGGVHGKNFPLIVADPNAFQAMDTTEAAFDERIATEYIDDTTTNPLVKGISVQYSRNSDFVVNMADNNATIRSMTDPAVFRSTCKTVLQKLIEIVPPTSQLSANPLTPYEVKPYALRLFLQDGGVNLTFTGDIRVRTTNRSASSISSVALVYKDRAGDAVSNSIATTFKDTASGYDDSFAFYTFNASLPVATSISSFTVTVSYTSGGFDSFTNNNLGYPISDTLLFQQPQSCSSNPSLITITAAVRNTTTLKPTLNFLGRRYTNNIVPTINTTSTPLLPGPTLGAYTLYNLTLPLNATQSTKGHFNLTLPTTSLAIDLTLLSTLPQSCQPLSLTPPTPPKTYHALGCILDPANPRALSGPSTVSSNLTPQLCADFCSTTYPYFGLEYSTECYCGSYLTVNSSSTQCTMPCAGSSSDTCGGPNALSLYQNDRYVAPKRDVLSAAGWRYEGCFSDDVGERTLQGYRVNDDALTLGGCAAVCDARGYGVMGTEYHGECYCGSGLGGRGWKVADEECDTLCSGDATQACGGANRISVYSKIGGGGLSVSSSSSSTVSVSSVSSSSSTLTAASTSSSSTSTVVPGKRWAA